MHDRNATCDSGSESGGDTLAPSAFPGCAKTSPCLGGMTRRAASYQGRAKVNTRGKAAKPHKVQPPSEIQNSMTSSQPIISVSGLRGIIGKSLTPELAIRYVAAFAGTLAPGPVLLTRDGRTTGPMLANAVQSALAAAGRDVLYAGVAATPTTGVLVQHHKAAGGIQISASHNPFEYNGLKLFGKAGRVIPAVDGEIVLQRFKSEESPWANYDQVGHVHDLDDSVTAHLDRLLAIVDVDAIRRVSFRVLLDSNHGAGATLGRPLLEALGCEVTYLGAEAHGNFAHLPEPTSDNLKEVGKSVVDCHAAVGFCQDPDADRLALIDETGTYVGEEFTLALCVDHVLSQHAGPIVTNCSTSRMSEDIAQQYGVTLWRSKVGEANVADMMIAKQARFGGEGNGGPIDPRVVMVRDSFVGMALILDALASNNVQLSDLCKRIPQYQIEKTKVTIRSNAVETALDALQTHFTDAQADRLDGLRLDWPGRWLLVRASNTEPVVRLIAECESESEAVELCAEAASVLQPFS